MNRKPQLKEGHIMPEHFEICKATFVLKTWLFSTVIVFLIGCGTFIFATGSWKSKMETQDVQMRNDIEAMRCEVNALTKEMKTDIDSIKTWTRKK